MTKVNEILDDSILRLKLSVAPQKVAKELKEQLLAEVLDIIENAEATYPQIYSIALFRQLLTIEVKEMFK